MEDLSIRRILNPVFIVSVLLLLLNDFYLKHAYPSLLTGKISDVCGLFAFPFFFSTLFPKAKMQIHIVTLVGFLIWKMPVADAFINLWNNYMPYSIGRVKDYTDYYALLVLPLSFHYKVRAVQMPYSAVRKSLAYILLCVSSFAFMATAGTHGNIKLYELPYAKGEVNVAIKAFFNQYPEFKVPHKYRMYTEHYGGSNESDDEWIREANADSVSFSFYFPDNDCVVWCGFVGMADDWYTPSCELGLLGYIVDPYNNKWKFDADISRAEKKKIKADFERHILSKVKAILEKGD
jgi:hypothetical protein